ncbi:MAG: PIN domain-containing protein [Chloroflexota bacterium]|nr:PIN domain-containing protein [Chloroflexota bacterium]
MIFLDTNVIIYAVGRLHPLRERSWQFFREIRRNPAPLVTSAEVLQELLHVYASTRRMHRWDRALSLLTVFDVEILPLAPEDVIAARRLYDRFTHLRARDLCHLAFCQRVGATSLETFDRELARAAAEILA